MRQLRRSRPAGWRGWRRQRQWCWRLAHVRYPLGPRTCARQPWTWCNRWRPEPPWCPCNTSRLSGLLATASLLLKGVRLHLDVYIYHPSHALVLKCLCIDAVLERNRNWVDDESIGMLLYYYIFQPTSFCEILQRAWQHQWKQFNWVGTTPYQIVGWTELHEKSIKNQMRGMNK